jgi:hypothetical protein
MVALPQMETDQATGNGWQDMRHQLFGHKRERDAEDRLLAVLTQLETRLAAATGVFDGALRSPNKRAQALRALQEGVNDLVIWHQTQMESARAAGLFHGPVPEATLDALRGARVVSELFEGAQANGTRIECGDVISGVAQLRGIESDAYFFQALTGLLAMLRCVYERATLDEPTASTAEALRGTWDVLVDEISTLGGPGPMQTDAGVAFAVPIETEAQFEEAVAVSLPLAGEFEIAVAVSVPGTELPLALAESRVDEEQSDAEMEPLMSFNSGGETAPDEVLPETEGRVIFPSRFFRMELVAC